MLSLLVAMCCASAPLQAPLSEVEVKEGFESLFDGKAIDQWVGWRQSGVPRGWSAVGGVLTFTPGVGGGDLRTREMFSDFDLRLEWKISLGGNSGIIYRATLDQRSAYETGPEYQVLDNTHHADGKNPLTSAGSLYALIAPPQDFTRPVGEFNEARIVAKGNHVEHWLNGQKLLEYELGSPEWKQRALAAKFQAMMEYGTKPKGYIVLQDHGNAVEYRNLRIRRF